MKSFSQVAAYRVMTNVAPKVKNAAQRTNSGPLDSDSNTELHTPAIATLKEDVNKPKAM